MILIAALCSVSYFYYSKKADTVIVDMPSTSTTTNTNVGVATTTSIVYKNSDYGFNFTLPMSWSGYNIINSSWKGTPLAATSTQIPPPTLTGPKLLIRNPKWTSAAPYEDIPVLVFTIAQWDMYGREDFNIFAAPIPASELARNNKYVFALPPRWDFDYSINVKEAEDIIASHPLKAFNN